MASTQEYVDYVMEQIKGLQEVAYRKMMGEYILYYQGKIFGGIYDNRFLIKITEASKKILINGKQELPYPGAKMMFLIEEIEDKELLENLIPKVCEELELPKSRKRRNI